MITALPAYLLLCLVMTATPGLDTAVVVRNTVAKGTRTGILTACGCASGLFIHAAGVALGLSTLLLQSAALFEIVRWCGAILLIAFGASSLWSAWRGHRHAVTDVPEPPPGRAYLQGLGTNLTNPKATLFFLSALPQFVAVRDTGNAVAAAMTLAVIAGCFSCGGLSAFAVLAGYARRGLSSPRIRRLQEATLGAVLVALGIRVATQPTT